MVSGSVDVVAGCWFCPNMVASVKLGPGSWGLPGPGYSENCLIFGEEEMFNSNINNIHYRQLSVPLHCCNVSNALVRGKGWGRGRAYPWTGICPPVWAAAGSRAGRWFALRECGRFPGEGESTGEYGKPWYGFSGQKTHPGHLRSRLKGMLRTVVKGWESSLAGLQPRRRRRGLTQTALRRMSWPPEL